MQAELQGFENTLSARGGSWGVGWGGQRKRSEGDLLTLTSTLLRGNSAYRNCMYIVSTDKSKPLLKDTLCCCSR